ncbi:MAG: glycosyltransferase family 2 protein [Chloroflexi bacterium]|nr:MAG: glycosyltransferase family 2 protein [Chloroflexota bacterium]TME44093.1 MAG: glycosyltransferase family 2 protein [Chloroflexota bacterium]
MSQRDLAVVVVSHNTRRHVLALLDSLAADPEMSTWETVVIDNASTDGTVGAIASQHRSVHLMANNPQRGFAGALNQAAALTTAPFIVTVNPDARVPVGTFAHLLRVLKANPGVAAVGPLIRYPDGTVQRHGMFEPKPLTALVVLLGLERVPFFRHEAERYYGLHIRGAPTPVDHLTGACLMFRREAFDAVGGFDEDRFFLYCEDVDWCLRARQAGWKFLFVPEAEITHVKLAGAKTRGAFAIRQYYRSLRNFYAKHYGRSPLARRALWFAGAYLQEFRALLVNAARGKGLRY